MIVVPKDCPLCRLSESRINVVPGSGNPKAEILFIGEGPGKNEDLQALPFVGASGKFLEEMLGLIDLKRSDIFITNVVKCRPPNNRDPLPDEIKICSSNYLVKQILDINPKLIITLGRHSMNFFFPDKKISEVHGKKLLAKKQNGKMQAFLPLYHPAAALYNGSMREVLKQDFAKIPLILKDVPSS